MQARNNKSSSFHNIIIAQKNDDITVTFEVINTTQYLNYDHPFPSKNNTLLSYAKEMRAFRTEDNIRILKATEAAYMASDTKLLDSICAGNEKSSILFEVMIDNKSHSYQLHSISFHVPKMPHLAINWLWHLVNIINSTDLTRSSAIFLANPIRQLLQQEGDSLRIDSDTWNKLKNETCHQENMLMLIQQLLTYSHMSSYHATLEALEKLYNKYKMGRTSDSVKDKSIAFATLAQIDLRMRTLYSPFLMNTILNEKFLPADRLRAILTLLRKTPVPYHQSDLTFIMKAINHLIKEKLYASCVGQVAHDGGEYKFSYTEWYVILHAEFSLDSTGRIHIINLDKNMGYNEWYAPGRKNHRIFREEMIFLGNVLGLHFEPDCDFHKEMVFDLESSQKLQQMGLHWNEKTLHNLRIIRNQFTLFSRADIDEPTTHNILHLPVEILGYILKQTGPHAICMNEDDMNVAAKLGGKLKIR